MIRQGRKQALLGNNDLANRQRHSMRCLASRADYTVSSFFSLPHQEERIPGDIIPIDNRHGFITGVASASLRADIGQAAGV
jgi:hypothetical protein